MRKRKFLLLAITLALALGGAGRGWGKSLDMKEVLKNTEGRAILVRLWWIPWARTDRLVEGEAVGVVWHDEKEGWVIYLKWKKDWPVTQKKVYPIQYKSPLGTKDKACKIVDKHGFWGPYLLCGRLYKETGKDKKKSKFARITLSNSYLYREVYIIDYDKKGRPYLARLDISRFGRPTKDDLSTLILQRVPHFQEM